MSGFDSFYIRCLDKHPKAASALKAPFNLRTSLGIILIAWAADLCLIGGAFIESDGARNLFDVSYYLYIVLCSICFIGEFVLAGKRASDFEKKNWLVFDEIFFEHRYHWTYYTLNSTLNALVFGSLAYQGYTKTAIVIMVFWVFAISFKAEKRKLKAERTAMINRGEGVDYLDHL